MNEMSPADIAAVTNNNGGGFGGGWGNNGDWIWIIVLFLLFGGGWGRGNNGGGGGGVDRTAIYDGFAINNIDSGIRSLQNGLCDSTFALNNSITSGFYGVQNGLCGISREISDCCCKTQRSIDGVRYDMATQACDTRNTIQMSTRDIIDNQNANARDIKDFLVSSKIESLQAENQALRLAASQSQQNSFISALSDAQTAELLRRLVPPSPIPAYTVPNPNCCYNPCACSC